MLILKNLKEKKLLAERNRKIREGLIPEQSRDQKENLATLFI